MTASFRDQRPHTERFVYRKLYQAGIFALCATASRLVPRAFAQTIGRTIGQTYARTQPAVRKTVLENLQLLCPSATEADAERVFCNFGVNLADYFLIGGSVPEEHAQFVTGEQGIEALEEARKHGRGAILATGHFSLFELGALLLAQRNFPVTVVTYSEPTPELTAWRAAFRRRWKAETIEVGADLFSSVQILNSLHAGRFTAMLADRPYAGPQLSIRLPGGTMAFSTSPAQLALAAEAPIIPVSIRRRSDNRYEMVAKECIWVRAKTREGRARAIKKATEAMAEALVEEFAKDPSQWYHFVPLRS